MLKLTAAGGVVFREANGVEVLLIYRRGKWDLPKGKVEEGETVAEGARREVFEEVGLSQLPRKMAYLGKTYHTYVRQGQEIGKTTFWYAMTLSEAMRANFTPQIEEDIEKAEWVEVHEAFEKVGYENLKEILKGFLAWYKQEYS